MTVDCLETVAYGISPGRLAVVEADRPRETAEAVLRLRLDAGIVRKHAKVVGTGQQKLLHRLATCHFDRIVANARQGAETVVPGYVGQCGQTQIHVVADVVFRVVVVDARGQSPRIQRPGGTSEAAPVKVLVRVVVAVFKVRIAQ